MSSNKFSLLASTCLVLFIAYAQAAKVDWNKLLGPNKAARMVWQKQSNELPVQFDQAGKTTTLMYFDTKEGTVRTLVGGSTAKTDPTFTWDGTRVVYFLPNAKQIGVVNIDGSNNNIISGNYDGGGRCYQSGNNHYVLAVQGLNLYRVNIDSPTDKMLVYTGIRGGYASGVTWASMSPDGKKIAGVFPEYPNVGIANVGSSSYIKFTPGGCWPTIARDGSNHVLYTIEPHTHIRIVASDGSTEVLKKELKDIWNDGGATEYECLRWSNDYDILSCISYHEPTKVCRGANPKIVRISTLEWSSPNNSVSGVEGNTDVFVYPTTTVLTPHRWSAIHKEITPEAWGEIFDIRGSAMGLRGSKSRKSHVRLVVRPNRLQPSCQD